MRCKKKFVFNVSLQKVAPVKIQNGTGLTNTISGLIFHLEIRRYSLLLIMRQKTKTPIKGK